jgi:NAD(P)-dependent dehydrogenase (short-subunit alcohol dehydrogenase family)
MELQDKVAIITGAGRGIGKHTAIELAAHGCSVLLVSRTATQLQKTVEEIVSYGGKAVSFPADLSKPNSVKHVFGAAHDHFGGIDILINNAAILIPSDLEDVTEEQWDQVMNVNLKAPFFLCQKALDAMKNRGGGYIINVSSTAALTVPPNNAIYGISKKALIGLSEAFYEKAKDYNVKVSTIYPGMTDTEMLRSFNPPVPPEKWMKTEDIVGCIMFLLMQSGRVVVKDIVPWSSKHDQI